MSNWAFEQVLRHLSWREKIRSEDDVEVPKQSGLVEPNTEDETKRDKEHWNDDGPKKTPYRFKQIARKKGGKVQDKHAEDVADQSEAQSIVQVPQVVAVETQQKLKKDIKGVAQKKVVSLDDNNGDEGTRIKLTTRQTVMPLMRLVQQLANQVDKLQAIKDMGFGGFLHLDFPHNYPEFSAQLVSNFDAVGMKIDLDRNRSLDVKVVDVHMVYGIPSGGKEIADAKDGNANYKEVLRSYKRYHGGVLPNNVNKLVSKLAPAETPLDDD
uniref:Uncharacterized protein n=1 Tax=Chenopodium quinoa TaxID=63459 RepID=A0A803N2J2_CHEQI